jgi:hypothetical protein
MSDHGRCKTPGPIAIAFPINMGPPSRRLTCSQSLASANLKGSSTGGPYGGGAPSPGLRFVPITPSSPARRRVSGFTSRRSVELAIAFGPYEPEVSSRCSSSPSPAKVSGQPSWLPEHRKSNQAAAPTGFRPPPPSEPKISALCLKSGQQRTFRTPSSGQQDGIATQRRQPARVRTDHFRASMSYRWNTSISAHLRRRLGTPFDSLDRGIARGGV